MIQKYLIQYVNIALLLFLINQYFIVQEEYSRTILVIGLCAAFFETMIILNRSRRIIRPVTVYLFAFLITNFQFYLDLFLGNVDTSFYYFVNPNTINHGVLISSIALVSFGISYSWFARKKSSIQNVIIKKGKNEKNIIFIVCIVQFLCFFVWMSGLSADDFVGDSYLVSGAYDNGRKAYGDVLFSTSQIVSYCFFVKYYNNVNKFTVFLKRIPKLLLLTSLLYVVIKLMSGDRGGAIWTLLLLLYIYVFVTRRTPNLVIIISIILFGSMVMTSISLSRKYGSSLSFKEKVLYVKNNPIDLEKRMDGGKTLFPFTSELAGSVRCTHIGLNEVRYRGDKFHYGEFHMCYVLNMIPFMGNTLINDVLQIQRTNRSSSEYITVSDSGLFYNSGLGTTQVIDNYLEFGIVGVILAFMFMGWLFRVVDSRFLSFNGREIPWWLLIAVFSLCAYSISIPRGYFLYYVKFYLWGVLYCYIVVFLNYLLNKKYD